MQGACATFWYVTYPAPHFLLNGTIFEEKKLLNLKHVFRFPLQALFEIFPIVRRIEQDITKVQYIRLHVKYTSTCHFS
jgi:hypothetical protein